ncbi:MAG: biopolymer transporter ExbD [Kofleriaceae bacterium]
MRALLAVAVVVVGGCVDHGPGPQGKKVDVSSHILRAVPADLTRFDLRLGDALTYVGNKVDVTSIAPGGTVNITHYWKVERPIGARWRVFGMVRGPTGSPDFMNLVATDMQAAYPPANWRAGDLIEDTQQIVLRPDWRAPTASVLVGLIEVGKHGTLDRMPAAGPRTLDSAVVAATLTVDLTRAPPPKGTIHVARAKGAIAIDGVASDVGWTGVPQSPEFVTAEGGTEPTGKATARLTWDDQYLYVFVNVTDTDIYSPYKKHDEPIWKEDCVELFIDADGNQRGYIELQVNPNNTTFDSWFASTRAQPGDVTWESGMVTAVKVTGTPDKSGDADSGWDAEIGIPWTAIRGRDPEMKIHLPPQLGDRWKLNVVRVDKRGQAVTASTWNRISIADFHALNRMLTVVFADPAGGIVPGAPNAGPPAKAATDVPIALVSGKPAGVVIEVQRTGEILFDGKLTSDVDGNLEALTADSALIEVTFRAAPGVLHAGVRKLIDRARAAGLTDLAFAAPPLAKSPAAEAVELPHANPLRITISAKLELEIAGKPVPDAALEATLRAAVAREPKLAVVLDAPGSIPHEHVVSVLSRASVAGVTRLALAK